MALSKSESKKEVSNLACIARILLGPCTDTLRDTLTHRITPSHFKKKFRNIFREAYEQKELFIGLHLLIYEYDASYSDFDIPLLYFFLQTVYNIHFPQPELGPFSSKENRSLSANIKRIYKMHKKYKYFQGDFLKDSAFERDWEKLFQTVKELEKYIGSATANQDAMKKIKNSSMDPDVEHLFISNLGQGKRGFQHRMPPFPYSQTDIEMMLTSKKEAQVYASRSIEDYLERFGERILHLGKALGIPGSLSEIFQEASIQTTSTAEAVDEGSSIMEELHIDQTKIMETGGGFIDISQKGSIQKTSTGKGGFIDISQKGSIQKTSTGKAVDEGSDTMEELHIDQTKIMETGEKTEPVTSKQLRELFNSFEIKIPHDPLIESFASGIVHKDVNNLVTTVNSLSHGVVLPTNTPSNTILIFEMEVVYDYDQLWVVKKDNSPCAFQNFLDGDSPAKVILITSKSLPIVKAKLTVYKKYKHVIIEKKIFLQHEHEEVDDVAKLIAYQEVMKFCSSVESVINAFSVDLYKIVTDYLGKPLTANKITQVCLEAFNKSEHLWDIKHPRSFSPEMLPISESPERDWRVWVATKISQKFSKKGELECTDAWTVIWNACKKTVEDLGTILSGLEEFRTRVLPVDQNKEIDEWLKREIIEDEASLRKYPSIIRWVAGQRDDKNVVKVYLSGGNTEEAKEAFKEKCKLKNADFEFVNIVGKKGMPKEIKEMKAPEREAPAIDKSALKELKKIVREHTNKLYARYSNINGIRIGVDGDTQPCIILYCLDKTLIPFGEKKLPETLAGWPCDVREKFTMFGMCTPNCSADPPELGCSIGIKSKAGSGSVGFMYESKNSDKYRSGFLTASHVAIKECYRLHKESTLLSNHPLKNNNHIIVHPSRDDNEDLDHPVGVVVESFFGNFESSEGLDFAVVKTNKIREGEKETVAIYNEDDGIAMESVEVMKTGRTTGITFGKLHQIFKEESIQMYHPPQSDNFYIFQDVYVVQNNLGEAFFKPGDSGSGVFVVEKTEEGNKPGKALGILFAGTCSEEVSSEEAFSKEAYPEEAYVCKIAKILDTLGLKIVR